MVAFRQPTAAIMHNGNSSGISVFVFGVDNRIYWSINLNQNNWSNWLVIDNIGITASDVAVSRISDGRIIVVVKGTDNRMYYNLQNGSTAGTWLGWLQLGIGTEF
jgi:hypothetical protein